MAGREDNKDAMTRKEKLNLRTSFGASVFLDHRAGSVHTWTFEIQGYSRLFKAI